MISFIIEIDILNANSADPDQTPRSWASDLVYTVWRCPFFGTLGTNGLIRFQFVLYFYQFFIVPKTSSRPLYTDRRNVCTFRKHAYSNVLKILSPKIENFQIKNSDIFHISAQNIDCGYSWEPPRRGGSNAYYNLCFLAKNQKNNVYPCEPKFYYIKVGFKRRWGVGGQKYIGAFSWCFGAALELKAPYSSKVGIVFIQERSNTVVCSINTFIKCGIWQPVKFLLVSRFWTG